ncbi:hypothetical protein QTG56_25180 (plasmid) [Rossellomorea sp. AcN35-11]|nr:hypothetical protein [Rossellomorea aquimaris]WJV31928.1 hypothetical protein QTG56_25180 [Rossellomorea sp. AcN35-11]
MTTVEEVIELGQFSFWEVVTASPKTLIILILLLPLLYLIYAVYEGISEYKKYSFVDSNDIINHILIFLMIFVAGSVVFSLQFFETREHLVEIWKSEIAYPYIESLDEQKSEIVYLKFDPEIETSTQGMWSLDKTNEQLTPMTIAYKDNTDVKNLTQWMDTSMILTDEEDPFVSYVVLEKDLGNGVDMGIYLPEVYLPEDYKFTDIK